MKIEVNQISYKIDQLHSLKIVAYVILPLLYRIYYEKDIRCNITPFNTFQTVKITDRLKTFYF